MKRGQYARSHADRVNLLIHLLAVPMFWLASISGITFLAMALWIHAGWAALALAAALGFQAIGHKRERLPPEPFSGPVDFVTRIFSEQFLRFPGFVLSGDWWRNFRARS